MPRARQQDGAALAHVSCLGLPLPLQASSSKPPRKAAAQEEHPALWVEMPPKPTALDGARLSVQRSGDRGGTGNGKVAWNLPIVASWLFSETLSLRRNKRGKTGGKEEERGSKSKTQPGTRLHPLTEPASFSPPRLGGGRAGQEAPNCGYWFNGVPRWVPPTPPISQRLSLPLYPPRPG